MNAFISSVFNALVLSVWAKVCVEGRTVMRAPNVLALEVNDVAHLVRFCVLESSHDDAYNSPFVWV